MCLGGRRIFVEYEFWITNHGEGLQTYQELSSKVRQMYHGGPATEALLKEANIGYVYIGPK